MQILDPKSIPKFVTPLFRLPTWRPQVRCHNCREHHYYNIAMIEFLAQVLPKGFPKTTVYGFESCVKGSNYLFRGSPGATFETCLGIPVTVHWTNKITKPYRLPVDPTLHWANPNGMPTPEPPFLPFPPGYPLAQKDVPTVVHLHGGQVPPNSDGFPEAWFTADGKIGSSYLSSTYTYPNSEEVSTLWYHDHSLGVTRLNVYSGLAGFYITREPGSRLEYLLPLPQYEIPLMIQDKTFYEDGSLWFPTQGTNPQVHPYWTGFSGNTITVNGRTWPNLDVQRRQYRFRILNASLGNTWNLTLSNGESFTQIGTDGGFLPHPVELTTLSLAPAERADVLIDFSKATPGSKIILKNDMSDSSGDSHHHMGPEDDSLSDIMQFTVEGTKPYCPAKLPSRLNYIPKLVPNQPKRILTLVTQTDEAGGVVADLLNGQHWHAPVTETPLVGSTELWEIVNLSGGSHPIHLHLINFLIQDRQMIDSTRYLEDWLALNGPLPYMDAPKEIDPGPYLIGDPIPPRANEVGWKDTAVAFHGQILRLVVRFAPGNAPEDIKPGTNLFPFDPSVPPGYVWHCHILPHEDNDMMRPLYIRKN